MDIDDKKTESPIKEKKGKLIKKDKNKTSPLIEEKNSIVSKITEEKESSPSKKSVKKVVVRKKPQGIQDANVNIEATESLSQNPSEVKELKAEEKGGQNNSSSLSSNENIAIEEEKKNIKDSKIQKSETKAKTETKLDSKVDGKAIKDEKGETKAVEKASLNKLNTNDKTISSNRIKKPVIIRGVPQLQSEASVKAQEQKAAEIASAKAKANSTAKPSVLSEIKKRPSIKIIRDNDALPPLSKSTASLSKTTANSTARQVGVMAGYRPVSKDKNFNSNDRKNFKSSNFQSKEFTASDNAKGKKQQNNSKSRINYQKKDDRQAEKEFDISKKKKINLDSVPKKIDIMSFITPGELARKMNLKAGDIISKLISMGSMVTINQQIDSDTAAIIANEFGCQVHLVDLYEETIIETEKGSDEDLVTRAPIVTIMGHVDHGKTKLLDAIRHSDVVSSEAGGITQHIGAYKINFKNKGEIVFIDTPGHAAFSAMRQRGAKLTDIVVLVVAANDGVMAQTREALEHAKAAKVPIIVAINKCDLANANPDKVKEQLSKEGLIPEEWGGDTQFVNISALKKEGIDDLLDSILVQSEVLGLKANPKLRAEAIVLEAKIDQGRGIVASVLVKNGTLKKGDNFVCGLYSGHVKTMISDTGIKINEAGPSTPVEITGLSDIPQAGDPLQVTVDEKTAKTISTKRQELDRQGQKNSFKHSMSLDEMSAKLQEGNIIDFNIIIKGDVQGSVEAIRTAIEKLDTALIKPRVLRCQAGAIIEDDISLASSAENSALIIAFNVRPTPKAQEKAEKEGIEIRKYSVIYDIIDDIKTAMEGRLDPIKREEDIGTLSVRQVFKVPKIGLVAGCMVNSGKITRKSYVRVIRDNIQISDTLIHLSSLKRFKDDVKEVLEGFECGVGLENFQDLKEGDILEAVDLIQEKQKLDFADEII